MSLIFQWILFEAVLPRKEEREIPQCNFITARTCAQSFRQIMQPVHNVFDSLGPGSTVGEKGKKRGQIWGQIGKISASKPFPPPPSDYTSRLALLANCFPFPHNSEPGPRLSFDRDHLRNKIIKTRSPKTTAKLIQNNVYCFFITIFRMAIPAFFRFTDITVLLLFLFRFTDVT